MSRDPTSHWRHLVTSLDVTAGLCGMRCGPAQRTEERDLVTCPRCLSILRRREREAAHA